MANRLLTQPVRLVAYGLSPFPEMRSSRRDMTDNHSRHFSKRQFIVNRISSILWLSLVAALMLPSSFVFAQQMPSVNGRQFPLNQMTPPGTAAYWAVQLGRATPEYFQPVRVSLPTSGTVTFFEGAPDRAHDLAAPGQASLLVGRMYRLRISGMPEFPGVDFFPSIELIDRLHPPAGKAEEFPIEFELTTEEFEWAASGRLMTKVVYLEQPNRVPATSLDTKERIKTVEPFQNAIAEADLLGRPVAIVRLGGRTPDPNLPELAFFGPGGPIRIAQPVTQILTQNRRSRLAVKAADQTGVFHLRQGTIRRVAQR